MKDTVISTIVEYDLCIGCGVCSAICPEQSLEMQFNHFGEYNPVQKTPCSIKCGLCVKVCPFANGNENEDTIGKALYGKNPGVQYRSETGYFLDNYVGYAPDTRTKGASGGMATWMLTELMKKGIADYVIAVVPHDDPEKLFTFAIFSDPESVATASGSAYYPVELSGVLKEIQNRPGKCAVIGLPCFIKAIRLAQKSNGKLKERIVFTLGLTCGQSKSKQFTEYTSALSGIIGSMSRVHYRGKSPEQKASNFYFSFTSKESNEKRLFWDDGIAVAWNNRWFTPSACNYCDDVFSECADVAFMDAWLPEYSVDSRGTSLVIVRSVQAQHIIDQGIESKKLNLVMITVQKVIESQAEQIIDKKINCAYRLYVKKTEGAVIPQKRIKPVKNFNPFQRKIIILKDQMRISSRTIWTTQRGKGPDDLIDFRKWMKPYLARARTLEKISAMMTFPIRFVQYIKRKVKGKLNG